MGRQHTHPGEVLAEEFMKPLGLSARALGAAIGVPGNRVSDIIRQRRDVSADTAIHLARYFGSDPRFWLNLQAGQDLSKAAGEHDYSGLAPRPARQQGRRPPTQSISQQSSALRADSSIAGRRFSGALRRCEIVGESILQKLKAESDKLSDESKKIALDQAGNRLRESIAELRQFAGAIPDRGQGARILKMSFNLMFAVADTVSRVERKWVPRFFRQSGGHESVKARAKKAQEGWQELALTIAKEKNQKNPHLSVASVAHNVICDERWSPKGSRLKERRPKERTVYDFLRRKNAWRNEERLQVN
jgi:addiction module HigA family antidote